MKRSAATVSGIVDVSGHRKEVLLREGRADQVENERIP